MGPQSSIAHFRILARLGQGGMGVVYRAEDQKLGRPVALKVLKTPDADGCYSESALRRFEREARAASALNHPNILTVYEIGEVDGAPYIATEYVEGATLRARLAAGPIPLGEALDIAMQSAGALAAAHTAGIVHRDIKPENIMVRPDGLVKVLDFGLAKLGEREKSHATDPEAETGTISLHETARGHVVGTPRYMSPEQARGLGVDARTDIFSLGVTIYEMAAGRRPFEGLTTSDVMASILKDQPPLFDAPAELQRILRKALEKNRDDRYQTPKDLQVDLKRLKQVLEDGGAGLTTGPPARTRRYRRSAAVVAIALAAVGAGLFLYERSLPALGPKDMVLLTDFENQTGDPVFDNTLKHALTAQIEQSRYVTALPDVSVRETLAFMGQSREARVTPAIGREICRRNGLKAQVEGSIAALGTHYALSLAAVNAATGADIARVQTEADSKETVLHALGGAAGELRRKLGDSIASIRKYDAPLEATTTSLDALYAYSQGQTELHLLHNRAAMPYFQRAVELDPNFAEAWRSLANAHSNIDNMEEARAASQKAYDLRDRVSELERLVIESTYYHIRQDRQKVIEILEVAVHAYPRSLISWNNLANAYKRNGQDERSLAAFRALLAFAPQSAPY